MIGVGVVTCDRPDYFDKSLTSITTHLQPDVLCTFHDRKHEGVAVAKNDLLRNMLDAGCDWLFVAEDDIIVTSPLAIDGYLQACEDSGWNHLMFHGHGPFNHAPRSIEGPITLWPNYVGAWSVYHRDALLDVGLMDEHFHNAWEHVEHSLRLAQQGHTPPWPNAADATGSERWLQEIPGSFEHSAIRRGDWLVNVAKGREYWSEAYPETYRQVFGES